MIDSCLYIINLLSFVSPHQEHANLDTLLFAKSGCDSDLFYRYTALHSIKDALRPAFGTDPDSKAVEGCQSSGNTFIYSVGSRDAFKRNSQTAPLHLSRIFEKPAIVDSKDIVCKPKHFRVV